MKNLVFAAAVAFALPTAAAGATIYENPYNTWVDSNASCMFNVPCAELFDVPPSRGGQSFQLSDAVTLRAASFTELDFSILPSSIAWEIYKGDGPGGAPGTLITSGTGGVSAVEAFGTQGPYQRNKVYFDLPNVALEAGSYVLALQITAPTYSNFWVEGQALTGAWQRFGDEPWGPRYGGSSAAVSVAIGLYDSPAPEPGTWGLLTLGFGIAGAGLRRLARGGSPAQPPFG